MLSAAAAILSALGGAAVGALLAARALRRAGADPSAAPGGSAPVDPPPDEVETAPPSDGSTVGLIAGALRSPLARLRRWDGAPSGALEELEHVAWQARMLISRPRPMQAAPTPPMALIQEAAEQVEALRLGKVPASWTLRCRQPVHVDPDRTRAAFRELLASAAAGAGEEGRVGIRILPGSEPGYPVRVEIEIGRRHADPDPLALRVAQHILEGQGAQVAVDGRMVRVSLRSAPAELGDEAQTPSNR